MKITPKKAKYGLSLYPPFIGAGVKISYISNNFQEVHVTMKLRWYNRNSVGTHFGGSLYSMIDPQIMLMLTQILGKDYIIWDKAAEIEFVSPGRGTVKAEIKLSKSEIADIKAKTENGDKYLPKFDIEIKSEDGKLVAKVNKTLYIRKKRGR